MIIEHHTMVCDECGEDSDTEDDRISLLRRVTEEGWKSVVWEQDGIDYKHLCEDCARRYKSGEMMLCLRRPQKEKQISE